MLHPTRIVNIGYVVDGLHFDAAIDCNWQLHNYGESPEVMEKRVPIELFCFDHKEWDIRMLFQDLPNDQGENYIQHTEVKWEGIVEETKKWIEEMMGQISEPKNHRDNEKEIMPLF